MVLIRGGDGRGDRDSVLTMMRGEQRSVTLWEKSLELLANHLHEQQPALFGDRPWHERKRDSQARGQALSRDEARARIHDHPLFIDPGTHTLRDQLMELLEEPRESLSRSDADLLVQRAFLAAKLPMETRTFEELWWLHGLLDRVLAT